MRLAEAKDMVLGLMLAGQPEAERSLMVSAVSPDVDPGKFDRIDLYQLHTPDPDSRCVKKAILATTTG